MFDHIEFQDDVDYWLYVGQITRTGYQALTDAIELANPSERNVSKASLLLVTVGGDADAAYRIARGFGHHYPDQFSILVTSECKSAGTLIAIGSSELVISDRGELGPLDVQVAKKEELFEMSSGLDIMKSLTVLKDEMRFSFRELLLDLRLGGGIGTKLAAELASEMSSNLISPVARQIDPIRLGEHQRALVVAKEYGKRLSQKFENIDDENVEKLTVDYPSHGFVIDRKEASTLFKNVRAPNDLEIDIEKELRLKLPIVYQSAGEEPKLCRLTEFLDPKPENNNDNDQDNPEEANNDQINQPGGQEAGDE